MWRTLAAGGLLAAALAGCGGSADDGSGAAPSAMTLRLSDLPGAYRRGDDSGCGALGLEGAGPELAELVREERPHGCFVQLERAYGAGPPLVESIAVVFDSDDAAKRALRLDSKLLGFLSGELGRTSRRVPAPANVGDETTALFTADALVEGRTDRPAFALVWRSGSVVGAVVVGGMQQPAAAPRAVALARRQQHRIEHPKAVEPESDVEVPLNDPAIGVPVYWLGSTLRPGGGLPDLTLQDSAVLEPGGGPGNRVKLDYAVDGVTTVVRLDIWTSRDWARFRRTPLGRTIWSARCTRVRPASGAGRGTLYVGYAVEPHGMCPKRAPDRYLAHLEIGGVVVAVNMPYCLSCTAAPPGPYNSRAGMEAVIRGLRLRPGG